LLTNNQKRVFVTGRDGVGWSIDHDRSYVERFLTKGGMSIVRTPITASVLHSVWWRTLFGKKGQLLRAYARIKRQKIIATVTNEVFLDDRQYAIAKKFVDTWVTGNREQQNRMNEDGVRTAWQPFYVDEQVFKATGKSKEELCYQLGIKFESIKNRYVISNFQRDTNGYDLTTPKQQKDPERLIRILSRLPNKNDWILLLAGPRRHFVVEKCKRLNIPYYFVGTEPQMGVDDIRTNMQSDNQMSLLNQLADCSLTTSQWEGGPKAILEGAYAMSYVLTTPVGNAPDLLPKECFFDNDDMAINKLSELIEDRHSEKVNQLIKKVQTDVLETCGYEPMLRRWQKIYRAL